MIERDMKKDMGASADADQALAVPATPAGAVGGPSGFDPSREFILQVVDAVRDVAEGRKPQSFGSGSPHSTAVHLGLIEECSQKKPCPMCGTPRHNWTYWTVTLAGQAYLALASAIEARRAETTGSVHESAVGDSRDAQ